VKKLSIVLALAGLAIGTALVASFGFGKVSHAIASAGWGGFAAVCAWQFVIFVPLGLGWDQLGRACGRGQAWLYLWARMVRDASANILPFSQIGGFVFGARVLTLHGIPWPSATALTVVDITAEFLAEVGFVGLGIAILLARTKAGADVAVPLEVGLGVAIVGVAVFVVLQQGAGSLFSRIAGRIAGRRVHGAQQGIAALNAALAELYRHPARLFGCFLLHFVGWILSGMADWVAFHAIGVPIDIDRAVAIEALLSGVAAVAFLVPVNAGVQEASYAGFGALFGIPVELSLAVSLIRRARDITVGVPILLCWQFLEVRRLRTAPS
jgi:putative membrane protein